MTIITMTSRQRFIVTLIALCSLMSIRGIMAADNDDPLDDYERRQLMFMESVIRTKNMTNPMTCRETYDHCVNGDVAGERGQKSPSSDELPPVRMSLQNFQLSRCFCDIGECRKYGDCCPDIVLADIERAAAAEESDNYIHGIRYQSPKTYELETNELHLDSKQNTHVDVLDLRWECHEFIAMTLANTRRQHVSVYMIASCPPTWPGDDLDDLCRRRVPTPSSYDYTLDVPVVNHATNGTYLNIYCAICNEDTESLAPLDIGIFCSKNMPNCSDDWSQWEYVAGEQKWRHISKDVTDIVAFAVGVPDKDLRIFLIKHGIRPCVRNLVDTCPSQWIGGDVERRLCSAYALTVYDRPTNVLYKNRHCAVCNGVARDAPLSCPTAKKVSPLYSGEANSHSYTLLIDFMGSDAAHSNAMTCGRGEICDRLRKRCRSFTCGHNFQLDNTGRCVSVRKQADSDDTTDGSMFLLVDCPKVTFYEGQFVFLSNNTIYVNETDTIYNVSDYEMVNETVVLVCASMDAFAPVWKFKDAQAIVSTVCVLVSLSCLAVHILVHVYVSQLRNLPGKNLLSLSLALFVGQFLFTFGLDLSVWSHGVCVGVAVVIHLCFLATFFWMNVMAFDVCRTFSSKTYLRPSSSSSNGGFLKYSLYAWLSPSLIVALALINDVVVVDFLPGHLRPEYGRGGICWIYNHRALLVFFVAPLALLLAKNVALFVATVIGIARTTRATRFARKDQSSGSGSGGSRTGGGGGGHASTDKARIVLYVKLALIMGLTWAFALIAALARVEFLWYLFIVFNTLQGAFIFFAFTFKRKILRLARDKFHGKKVHLGSGSKGNSFNKTQVTSLQVGAVQL